MTRLDLDNLATTRNRGSAFMFDPFGLFRFCWDIVVLAFMFYVCISLPLQYAGLADVRDETPANVMMLVFDHMTNAVLITDVLINLRTGYLDVKRRCVELNWRKAALRYVRTWFLVDVLAALPFDVIARAMEVEGRRTWTFRLLRMLRFGKLLRLVPFLARLEVRSGLRQTHVLALKFSLSGLFVAHLAACIWYAIGNNAGTWVYVLEQERIAKNITEQAPWNEADAYVASLYWSITTMSTMGYGDIVAGNTAERLFACAVMVFGSCFYAYGITSVITSLSGDNRQAQRLNSQKDQLWRYMENMHVPKELRIKLREYFVHYQNAADTFNEQRVFAMLSPGLRAALTSLANSPLLRRVSFFRETDEDCLTEMAQLLVPNLFAPDEAIILQGTVGQEVFIIKNGEVLVFLKYGESVQPLATLKSGDFFGEGALLKGKAARRAANVKAINYSLIYSLHVDRMNRLLPRFPKVQRAIEKIAAEREQETASISVRTFGQNPVKLEERQSLIYASPDIAVNGASNNEDDFIHNKPRQMSTLSRLSFDAGSEMSVDDRFGA